MECVGESNGKEERSEVRPDEVLTQAEAELLVRARAGQLPCPWCQRPLDGEFVFHRLEGEVDYARVRLSCLCGFVEY